MAIDRSRPGTEFERRDLAEDAFGLLGVTSPNTDRRADLVESFATRLAVFLSEQAGERLPLALDCVGDPHQDCASLMRRDGGDALFAQLRRRDRARNVLRPRAGRAIRFSPVAGLTIASTAPSAAPTHSPSISIFTASPLRFGEHSRGVPGMVIRSNIALCQQILPLFSCEICLYEYCTTEYEGAMPDSNKSATALRALEVMEILAEAGHPVSVAEVAEGIGADRSTAYRMLMTLHGAGYVTRDASQKNYLLGYKLLSLSRRLINANDRADFDQRDLASNGRPNRRNRPLLRPRPRRDRIGLSSQRRPAGRSRFPDRRPLAPALHFDRQGAARFSGRSHHRRSDRPRPAAHAVNTIVDPGRLRIELRNVRAQGFAYDDEFHDDMRCVAAPAFEKDASCQSGFSFSGPISRYTDAKLEELREGGG